MIKRGGILLVAVLVAGCSIIESEQRIDRASESASAAKALVERNATTGGVTRTKRARLSGEEIVVRSSSLPAQFLLPASYVTKGSQSLRDVIEDIAAVTGIQMRAVEVAQPSQSSAAPGAGSSVLTGFVNMEYRGTTRGLLDDVAGKANVSWRYNAAAKTVEFFRFETRTFSVYVPAAPKTVSAGISLAGVSGGSGGGGGGGAGTAGNVAVTQSMTIDPWNSLMGGIASILGTAPNKLNGGGETQQSAGEGTAIANPELGLITVTARPVALERVARYVSSINARFSQNVLIDVKIYSVNLDQQSSLGFNLNMLYSQFNKFGGSIVGPAPLQAGPGTPGVLTLMSKDAASNWNGSTLVAQALSQFGKVALQKQGQVLAVNGQPSPIQVANEISYVASSSVTQSPNVGATTTQTPGTKVVGFTANFTPLILGDNRILLTYQMQISSLAAPLTPNAQGVVTPNIASQSLQQQAFVKDGQAIVLFGYDESRDGVDTSLNFGGLSKASRKERQMIVIVMQVNAGVKDEQI